MEKVEAVKTMAWYLMQAMEDRWHCQARGEEGGGGKKVSEILRTCKLSGYPLGILLRRAA